jgi:hypothetical protein
MTDEPTNEVLASELDKAGLLRDEYPNQMARGPIGQLAASLLGQKPSARGWDPAAIVDVVLADPPSTAVRVDLEHLDDEDHDQDDDQHGDEAHP